MKLRIVLILTFFISLQTAMAQSRWMFGVSAGGAVSKTASSDTFSSQFTSRNRWGAFGNINALYNLSSYSNIHATFGIINKGYKLNDETLSSTTSLMNRGFTALNFGGGISFRQRMGDGSTYFTEKFGGMINYTISPTNKVDTFYNGATAAKSTYKVVQTMENKVYPLFYLGIAMGSTLESGDRVEFSVTYQQSFANSHTMHVQSGEFWTKDLSLHFRGGNLQIGLNYYLNLGNFKKNDEYFY